MTAEQERRYRAMAAASPSVNATPGGALDAAIDAAVQITQDEVRVLARHLNVAPAAVEQAVTAIGFQVEAVSA